MDSQHPEDTEQSSSFSRYSPFPQPSKKPRRTPSTSSYPSISSPKTRQGRLPGHQSPRPATPASLKHIAKGPEWLPSDPESSQHGTIHTRIRTLPPTAQPSPRYQSPSAAGELQLPGVSTPFPGSQTISRQPSEDNRSRVSPPSVVDELYFEYSPDKGKQRAIEDIGAELFPELEKLAREQSTEQDTQTSPLPGKLSSPTPEVSQNHPGATPVIPKKNMAANNVTVDGVTYDLNVPAEAAAAYSAVVQQNQTLRGAQPIQLTTDQFQAFATQAVNAVHPAQTRGNPAAIRNPVTTIRNGRETFYEYTAPPPGWDKDTTVSIDPWNGNKLDVTPFLNRVEGAIIQRPRALAFTYQRIFFFLDNIKDTIARQWAVNVRDALTNKKDNEFYFDDWTAFKEEFKKRFGLQNEAQLYYNQMVRYKQGPNQDARSYLDYFEQLRQKAGTSKDNAYQHLKGNSNVAFRGAALLHPSRPRDYDGWRAYMLEYQTALDEERSFQQLSTGYQSRFQQQQQQQPFRNAHPSSRFHLLPNQQPMDLSAMKQQKIAELREVQEAQELEELEERIAAIKHKRQGKKPSGSKPKPSTSSQRPGTSRDVPKQYSNVSRLTKQEEDRRRQLNFCFKCGQPGHFARNCPNRFINNLQEAEHTICQMDTLLNQALQFQEDGQFEEEDGSYVWNQGESLPGEDSYVPEDIQSQVHATDYQQDPSMPGDLIDFNDPQQPASQGF